jgi:multidrug efflux pump subunit AcrB
VPILQLGLSGQGLSEQDLNDIGLNFLRTQLVTVPGSVIPYPYGGKQRQVMINLNPQLLQAKGLSPADVLNAVATQYQVLPSGTAKISQFEYDVRVNGTPRTVQQLNDLPIRTVGGATIYLRDVATVSDGFAPQTNIVRQNGRRGVLVSILKAGNASTISVVNGIRGMLQRVQQTLPPQLRIQPLADQSIFVKAAVAGVIREAVIAACLTALMILLFLGSWRSTIIIAVSIPLSILSSIIALSFIGETINIMTLGGLALAVGILVDDATVTIENINYHLEQGKDVETAIMDGAHQIALPALVSTLAICIVFIPMLLLSGIAHFLFIPLAEAVVFAMLASYLLSRTLVPTLAKYWVKGSEHAAHTKTGIMGRIFVAFEHGFERVRAWYRGLLEAALKVRARFVARFLVGMLAIATVAIPLGRYWPGLGQDFFPSVDAGQIKLHLRARTGLRIEETDVLCDAVEASVRQVIPSNELASLVDNIGVPYSGINTAYSTSAPVGPGDADIFIALTPDHHSTAGYEDALRKRLTREFPSTSFAFLPADIVSQILNFGLPSPIDVQISGFNVEGNAKFADALLQKLRQIPGAVDMRIQQAFDYPSLQVDVDRSKAELLNMTQHDVASNLLISLSGSFQTSPSFWIDPKTGTQYNVSTQTPQAHLDSLNALATTPLGGGAGRPPQLLANVATFHRGFSPAVVSHYDAMPVIDIYGSAQGVDLGFVSTRIDRIIASMKDQLPRGSRISVRGQVRTMNTSFDGLLAGLLGAIVLVYLLMVVNFQSWLDPFIIITALPAALAGIVAMLFLTHTTISVPALTGAIMCMGVATANSILLVSFARERLNAGEDAAQAAMSAGTTRFRPVLMTALAMIIGMVPMALGFGDGGEQNAPLGRAVIGGLIFATVATLVFVPCVFAIIHGRQQPAQTT